MEIKKFVEKVDKEITKYAKEIKDKLKINVAELITEEELAVLMKKLKATRT